VVEMSKNSRGGPSRQKEGRPRSRSRSPRSQKSNIIQLSQKEEPPALAQIPWGKKDSPPVQNHTNQTPDAEKKIEEAPKASEVQLSIPTPPTFAPKAQTETTDLALLQTDYQDAASVSSMHVEVSSMLSQTSDAAEEPKANESEPMDVEEAKANDNEPMEMEIEDNFIEEIREEVKIVPSSLETCSPHKATTVNATVEVEQKVEEQEKHEEIAEEKVEEQPEEKPEGKPEETTEVDAESKIEEKSEPVQQPQATENHTKTAEEAKEETDHVYKEGDELEAADGSKFRIEKLNHKHDDATLVHCLRCDRSIQKKSVKSHITTKVHKGH
jgi:hypothetical protein